MHELGLTRNIVAIVSEHAGERSVKRVQLAVGPHACVERRALCFCFDMIAAGTVLEGASLDFVEADGDTFKIREYEFLEEV